MLKMCSYTYFKLPTCGLLNTHGSSYYFYILFNNIAQDAWTLALHMMCKKTVHSSRLV